MFISKGDRFTEKRSKIENSKPSTEEHYNTY